MKWVHTRSHGHSSGSMNRQLSLPQLFCFPSLKTSSQLPALPALSLASRPTASLLLLLGGKSAICHQGPGLCRFSIQPRSAPGDSFFLSAWWSANLWNNLLQSLAGMKTLGPVWPYCCLCSDGTAHTNTDDFSFFFLVEKSEFCPGLLGTLLEMLKASVFHRVSTEQSIKMTDWERTEITTSVQISSFFLIIMYLLRHKILISAELCMTNENQMLYDDKLFAFITSAASDSLYLLYHISSAFFRVETVSTRPFTAYRAGHNRTTLQPFTGVNTWKYL